jgi:hypothetical protein
MAVDLDFGDLIHGPASKPLTSVWIGLDEEGQLVVNIQEAVPWERRLLV